MKNKLKKLGLLAVLLLAGTFSQVGNAQRTDPIYEKKPGRTQCDGDLTVCICPEEVRSCECWIKVPIYVLSL